ncbi:hypothetical protein Val02_32140 [Virgisporangium aliadipatigenens]|uniref:NodB homology domain-containing protein n=1 Tax=Virgisporangium aliadipatigenens TaxID=741659 RepID=A0A8J3YM91_9ACTN|nr:polysaccharide deacetylase family protein [Virgisporangium aliadipatigenens]GIJ46328.1 hypothetical protein Val02_32140 [Virgisporangium aliadipatigenens]
MSETTVIVTAVAGAPVRSTLRAPGVEELDGRVPLLVAGDPGAEPEARAAGYPFLAVGRPGRAAARNAALAAAQTDLIVYVDGGSRPGRGWLRHLTSARRGHAAVLGRTRVLDAQGRERPTPTRAAVHNGRVGPVVSPFGGSALFDRRLLREVGAFNPAVRRWDDLYITGRLIGYGASLALAEEAVVDVVVPARWRDPARLVADGFRLEDLHRAAVRESRFPRAIHRPAGCGHLHAGALAAGRLARGLTPARLLRGRRVPVRTRYPSRAVYLTIDDGPSRNTPELLAVLRRHGATATFFVVGKAVREHPARLAEIVRAGHPVHGHSFTHRQFDMLSREEVIRELDDTQRLLDGVARPGPTRVRLPFGAGDEDSHVHDAVRRWRPDCELVQWSHDTEDWKHWPQCRSTADVDRSAARAAERVLDTDDLAGGVVLLHDSALGTDDPLADRFARVLLERLLTGIAARGLTTAALPGDGTGGDRPNRRDRRTR